MNAGLMASMDCGHLLRAIECGPMTDTERELVSRCYQFLDDLRHILDLCERQCTEGELIGAVRYSLENYRGGQRVRTP